MITSASRLPRVRAEAGWRGSPRLLSVGGDRQRMRPCIDPTSTATLLKISQQDLAPDKPRKDNDRQCDDLKLL
jgi:hypothetical protein